MNKSENFWLVVLYPKTKVHLAPEGYEAFRKSIFDLFEHVDRAWPTKRRGKPYRFRELECFKPLNKYLGQVQFVPRRSDDPLEAAVAKAIEICGAVPAPPPKGKTGGALETNLDWIVPVGHAEWCRSSYDDESWEADGPDERNNPKS